MKNQSTRLPSVKSYIKSEEYYLTKREDNVILKNSFINLIIDSWENSSLDLFIPAFCKEELDLQRGDSSLYKNNMDRLTIFFRYFDRLIRVQLTGSYRSSKGSSTCTFEIGSTHGLKYLMIKGGNLSVMKEFKRRKRL